MLYPQLNTFFRSECELLEQLPKNDWGYTQNKIQTLMCLLGAFLETQGGWIIVPVRCILRASCFFLTFARFLTVSVGNFSRLRLQGTQGGRACTPRYTFGGRPGYVPPVWAFKVAKSGEQYMVAFRGAQAQRENGKIKTRASRFAQLL